LTEETEPATASSVVPKNEEKQMVDQKTFRSLVGKIMYAVGKIAPSLAYATHDLATHMSNPSQIHWKAMKKLIGFMK
jgi:hypothetical protein